MIFADLCCGSGAVTLNLVGRGGEEPPAPYMGGKRRFSSILDLMGVRGCRPDQIIMVDAGPWATFWRTAVVDGRADEIADALEALGDRPERSGLALFRAIGEEPVPDDPVLFCAVFLALQHGNAMGRPVVEVDGMWRRQGYAHLSKAARMKGSFGERLRPWLIAPKVRRIGRLRWPPLDVIKGNLQEIAFGLGPGDVVYIDPPYRGTTGYGPHRLSRSELRAIADGIASDGAFVGISEREPIRWDGWHHAIVPDDGGWQARSFGSSTEWLTLSAHPARLPSQWHLKLEEK